MVMVWHDCKTDPPKINKDYIVYYGGQCWEQAWYRPKDDSWVCILGDKISPIKWAEVDLSEVE